MGEIVYKQEKILPRKALKERKRGSQVMSEIVYKQEKILPRKARNARKDTKRGLQVMDYRVR